MVLQFFVPKNLHSLKGGIVQNKLVKLHCLNIMDSISLFTLQCLWQACLLCTCPLSPQSIKLQSQLFRKKNLKCT